MADPTRVGSIEQLGQVLRDANVRFMVASEGDAISVPVHLGRVESYIHVRWEPTPKVVHVTAPLPLHVPADRLAEAALVLMKINHRLSVAGFHINAETGVPSFRTHALLDEDGTVALDILRALMTTAMDTAQRYLADLEALRQAGY